MMAELAGAPVRTRVYSGGPWERTVGYCRATRVGNVVAVAGTTAMTAAGLVGEGDAGLQARQCLATIGDALERAGATIGDVIRYRVFLTDPAQMDLVGPELAAVFGDVHPAGTAVVVAALIDDRLLVEIEVDAIIGSAAPVG